MPDIVDQETRSRMMAGIGARNTRPELSIRKALHARGFRYRLHAKDILGRPDLLFPRYRAVAFVHGCFWHRHETCAYATTPATRPEFWRAKFAANVVRDSCVRATLLNNGWRVAIIWECALRKPEHVELAADLLAAWLRNDDPGLEIGQLDVTADQQQRYSASLEREQ